MQNCFQSQLDNYQVTTLKTTNSFCRKFTGGTEIDGHEIAGHEIARHDKN